MTVAMVTDHCTYLNRPNDIIIVYKYIKAITSDGVNGVHLTQLRHEKMCSIKWTFKKSLLFKLI